MGKRTGNNAQIKFNPQYPYTIVCEGVDEYYFLIAYRDYLERNEREKFVDCHNVVDFGGINDINKLLNDIKNLPKYDEMKGFLIVRDAERDANSAVQSMQMQINRTWGVNIDATGAIKTTADDMKVGFFLLPGFNEQGNFADGTLEDLCLDIICDSSDPISAKDLLKCTDEYIDCVTEKRKKNLIWVHKNRLHSYLSATDKFVGDKLGEAAQKGAFDFSSKKLAPLKEMIFQMQG
ncbi:MAG: hypothetical protein IIZ54_04000 [Selenomonadaceae bacterium]|nr:hypothetical protein [Selenomonadaceae bacterium]